MNVKVDKLKDEPKSKSDILAHLALEGLREQRRKRRWGIFFKSLFAAYVLVIAGGFFWENFEFSKESHVAVVKLNGSISIGGNISFDKTARSLKAAFENELSEGVILQINSEGGSAVQSARIYGEIKYLRGLHPDKPIYAVIDDVCASGGYYIAAAADKIYADPSSLVGSIGATLSSFGFVDTMEKLGVERRVIAAGENKAILDPFSPLKLEDELHTREMLKEVHEGFITAVKNSRGDRLASNENVFSGLIWNGTQAKELGLIDDFGNALEVVRNNFATDEVRDYTSREGLIEEFANQIGVGISRYLKLSVDGEGIRMQRL
ncbi:MAG: S49 family peptidase [Arenicellales bacterium WSBS_2016_MAG_OTU3]